MLTKGNNEQRRWKSRHRRTVRNKDKGSTERKWIHSVSQGRNTYLAVLDLTCKHFISIFLPCTDFSNITTTSIYLNFTTRNKLPQTTNQQSRWAAHLLVPPNQFPSPEGRISRKTKWLAACLVPSTQTFLYMYPRKSIHPRVDAIRLYRLSILQGMGMHTRS